MKTIANIAKALAVAAAAVGSVACVIDHSQPAREISFSSTVVNKPKPNLTRTIIDNSVFPTGEQFKVYGYFSDDSFINTATYIGGENVGYDADNVWRCQSATTYYWPLSGKMKFYAYYPADITPAPTVNSSLGVSIQEYRIDAANMRDDVLYATNTVDCPPTVVAAPLVFSHALSQIGFTARLSQEYTVGTNTVSVAINSITLQNVYSTGNFQQNPLGWKGQKGLSTYTVLSGGSIAVGYVDAAGTPATIGTPVLMIPQSMPATASLTVVYTVSQMVGTSNEYSDVVTSTVLLSNQWSVNHKITYNLAISLDAITFDVSDCAWGETSGGEIYE